MAFNQKEQEIIKAGVQAGKTTEEIKGAVAKYRSGWTPPAQPVQAPQEQGMFSRIGSEVGNSFGQINQQLSGQGEYAGQSAPLRAAQVGATASGIPVQAAFQALPQFARTGLKAVGDFVSKGFNAATNWLSGENWLTGKLFKEVGDLEAQGFINPETTPGFYALKDALKAGSAIGQTAGNILITDQAVKAAKTGYDLTKTGVNKVENAFTNALDDARPNTKALYDQVEGIIKPKNTPQEAMGEVLQTGKSRPVTPEDWEAFKNIDTEGVKTYADLSTRINDSIESLSNKVDGVLSKDPTPIPLQNLVTKTTTASGQIIERNFVDTALQNLKELYSKTLDDVKLANIDDLVSKAQTTGLTRLEVNDLSRIYNAEFGSKAFSKVTGEPLTSVNAQAYENIRSGLKDVARQGMGGTEAAATDKVISSLYNVKDLVENSVAAVRALDQKVANMGILAKVGHGVTKYADVLTGGSIRGFIGGLLPRGAGYKTMNALDLEEILTKNLQIIRNALNSGSDDAIVGAVKQLEKSVQEVPKASVAPSATPVTLPQVISSAASKIIAPQAAQEFIYNAAAQLERVKADPALIQQLRDIDVSKINTFQDLVKEVKAIKGLPAYDVNNWLTSSAMEFEGKGLPLKATAMPAEQTALQKLLDESTLRTASNKLKSSIQDMSNEDISNVLSQTLEELKSRLPSLQQVKNAKPPIEAKSLDVRVEEAIKTLDDLLSNT